MEVSVEFLKPREGGREGMCGAGKAGRAQQGPPSGMEASREVVGSDRVRGRLFDLWNKGRRGPRPTPRVLEPRGWEGGAEPGRIGWSSGLDTSGRESCVLEGVGGGDHWGVWHR